MSGIPTSAIYGQPWTEAEGMISVPVPHPVLYNANYHTPLENVRSSSPDFWIIGTTARQPTKFLPDSHNNTAVPSRLKRNFRNSLLDLSAGDVLT